MWKDMERIEFLHVVPNANVYNRQRKYKSDCSDLEVIRDSWCKIVFYILGARFEKLLEEPNKYTLNFFSHLENSLIYQLFF